MNWPPSLSRNDHRLQFVSDQLGQVALCARHFSSPCPTTAPLEQETCVWDVGDFAAAAAGLHWGSSSAWTPTWASNKNPRQPTSSRKGY
ncbi:hypothetical protein MJO28_007244 [Puccinia striiformis f. sp. tritici]|uniref:Uncharacterized protein n=1 Tax=Puccinia striiformis f. sp. tritici TaxID=168172 RepID=A0ACC0EEN3_9BASI|nr:hypothetical protein MJO28_007244 [Puccinia striiformis f. sp. tritici]